MINNMNEKMGDKIKIYNEAIRGIHKKKVNRNCLIDEIVIVYRIKLKV